VNVAGALSIDGSFVESFAGGSGAGGNVAVSAGSLAITNFGAISAGTFGAGNGGSVTVNVAGGLSIDGSVVESFSSGAGVGGSVVVNAGSLAILNEGFISVGGFGAGNVGSVSVSVAGQLSINGFSGIFSDADFFNGFTQGGTPGNITVKAGSLTIDNGIISAETFGAGNGGNISVNVAGQLTIDGTSGNPIFLTGIGAGSFGSGNGGDIAVKAGALSIVSNGEISAATSGTGNGGDVSVISGTLNINGAGGLASTTGITAEAEPGSRGTAGRVTVVSTGALTVAGGGTISSSTFGYGNGGTVLVTSQGPLSLGDPGSGIIASATSTASGNAGSVTVNAPQITVTSGAEIASTTAGTGSGGSVNVATPGALVLDGMEVSGTQIAASAIDPQSGAGGAVTVAASSLTIEGGAQIASSTAGLGKGGDVNVAVVSDIVLPDPGPQISTMSTGSGDAGSVTVSAGSLLLANGAAISTEAATASGGNIALKVGGLLYLTSGEISASVRGETANGGNITIDSQFAVLNQSSIIAEATQGRGGNVAVSANVFIKSADSITSATGALGISGIIESIGPPVPELASELRSVAQVLRNSCAAQAGVPQSSLVEGGRGGLPQNPDATLPALYIAGRDMSPTSPTVPGPPPIPMQQTTARLTMRCG
jgi:large exoprotein involved in heme utilization and adhesion